MLPDSLAAAEAADRADPLRGFRERFRLPDGVIYLDGNSLGPLPAAAPARVAEVVAREWGQGLIRSWNDAGWIDAPGRIGDKIAAVVGVAPGTVTVADSTTVNIFKLVMAALADRPERAEILTEPGNFPTDLYVAQGIAALRPGARVRTVEASEIVGAIGAETAVVLLTHVNYRTGYRHDMAAITAAAKTAGAHIVWDLSHSTGAVALDLARDGVELAVGCGYKYLNGGPGAPSFLYVAEALQARLASPIAGWMGHAKPFAFVDDYAPAPGIERFLGGTPPMLSLLALEAGVDLFLEADPVALFAKGAALTALFRARMAALLPALPCVTPAEPGRAGSHLSFAHDHAFAIMQALIARGVIGDFRAPDLLRFGVTPLYLGFAEMWRACDTIAEVIGSGAWREARFEVRGKVT